MFVLLLSLLAQVTHDLMLFNIVVQKKGAYYAAAEIHYLATPLHCFACVHFCGDCVQ